MTTFPWIKFWPEDWARDLRSHPLDIEGAWIRIISQRLWWSKPRGQETLPLIEWSNILNLPQEQTCKILNYLKGSGIADLVFLDCNAQNNAPQNTQQNPKRNANVTACNAASHPICVNTCNALVTITSRRIYREITNREKNRIRQQRYRDKHGNINSNANVTHQKLNTVTGERLEAEAKKEQNSIPVTPKPNYVTLQKEKEKTYSPVSKEEEKTQSPLIEKLVHKSLSNQIKNSVTPQGRYVCKQCNQPSRLLMAGICQACYKKENDPHPKRILNETQKGEKPT